MRLRQYVGRALAAFRPAEDRRRTGRFGAGSGVAAQAEAAADLAATDGGVDGP